MWFYSILIICSGLIIGCEESQDKQPNDNDGEWLIPKDEVRDGGPGKDGIPSIDNPDFVPASQANFLEASDRVLGIVHNGKAKAYGHPVLDHHEIVNDEISGRPIAMTYCPLTGTGIAVSREINGNTTTFGVSGLLFNNNLIPYDRQTESNWSQMKMKSVNGELAGKANQFFQAVETKWATWKAMYPETEVLSRETDFNRNYERFPYGDYKNNEQLLFPVSNEDDRFFRKKRMLGVMVKDRAKVYTFDEFEGSTRVIRDAFNGQKLLIVGNAQKDFMVAFKAPDDLGEDLTFTGLQRALPLIMEDSKGNSYDVFGRVKSGPDEGFRLDPAKSYIGYWFAWAAFFPDVEVYNQ